MQSPHAFRRPVENAYLERERDRRFWYELVGVLGAVLLLGGGLLAYTWMHIELLRAGYRTDALERELHQVVEHERALRLEATYRAHPERIESRARAELGMDAPSLEQTLFYEELVP